MTTDVQTADPNQRAARLAELRAIAEQVGARAALSDDEAEALIAEAILEAGVASGANEPDTRPQKSELEEP